MDIKNAIIGFVLVAIFILPLVYLVNMQKNKDKKLQKHFLAEAKKFNVSISKSDVWNSGYCIGIDDTNSKLLYFYKKLGKEESTLIDLSEVKKCKTSNINRNVKTKAGNIYVIDRIELVFSYKDTAIADKPLMFYSAEDDMTLSDELQLVEKWQKTINSVLS
jgi:hypothetical protein